MATHHDAPSSSSHPHSHSHSHHSHSHHNHNHNHSHGHSEPPRKVDPIIQNAIRYTVSPKEYKALHEFIVSRSPKSLHLQNRVPTPAKVDASAKGRDDYNAAAVRASLRVFLSVQTGLKAWEVIQEQILKRKKQTPLVKQSLLASPNFRLSLSFSLLLFFHRILHRFFIRLRASLLTSDAAPFRKRNPRISKALTARLAPAIGASLAGFALGVYPGEQLRITIAIYVLTKAAEFAYNSLEEDGWMKNKPWWVGSWMLMPPVFGQLLHAFVFDPDCFPAGYGNFIMKYSPVYIQSRPEGLPENITWPDNEQLVSGLANISKLHYPAFVSPILFPGSKQKIPSVLAPISRITSGAHPAIQNLTCALLHPDETSCMKTFFLFYVQAFPRFAKAFTLILGLFALPRYKKFLNDPARELNTLAKSILRISMFVTGSVGTSWASICFFQAWFKRHTLPTQRWFWGGFLGGLWAFLERKHGRGTFLYSLRTSLDTMYKVGSKRRWWKSGTGADLWITVASLMVLNAVYEHNPEAVTSGVVRKSLGMLRGEGWVDRAKPAAVKTVKDE